MISDDASSERRLQRQRRLIAELDDEAVDLQIAGDHPAFPVIIDEISYARQSPVHEGRRSPYGALVVDNVERLAALADAGGQLLSRAVIDLCGIEPDARDLNHIRKMCNGLTTFLVRSPRGPEALFELNLVADEQRLAQLISPDIRVVQRGPDGVVKVFVLSRVYVFEHDEWRAKVYSSDAAAKLERIFFPNGPDRMVDRLSDLLSLCLHTLSSRHIGSTFVWFPDPERPPLLTPQEDWGRVPSARLFVGRPHHMEPIATLLAAIDGACVVKSSGEIERIETKLAPTSKAMDLISAEGGLRHTTAKRYSFDDPNCIVFVVSHDGPVTVYSDGMSVLQLRTGPSYASNIDGVARHDWFSSHRPKSCQQCETDFIVERLYVRYRDRAMSIECPVCRHRDLESDNAVEMHAWPRKPWTSWGVST
jgi:DNA integrity scanning protein DisA with diadenylate cyclase activity